MFETYTEGAIKAIMLAQEESRRLGHNYVGTEMLLLGLIGEDISIAAQVLKSVGLTLKEVRIEVERIIGRGAGFVSVEIPFTPGAKKVLSLAEYHQLGHIHLDTENLLLGLIQEPEQVVGEIFAHFGVELTAVREKVVQLSDEKIPEISSSTVQNFAAMETNREIRRILEQISKGRRGRSDSGESFLFERFTEKGFKVIMRSDEESRRLGHNFIGTEQLLIGLIDEETGIAAKVLRSMGVTLKDTRTEVERIIGRGAGFVAVEIPFTPRAKRVIELSQEESRQLGHNYIGTEHLLLGLIRVDEGVACRVLANLGVDTTKIRTQVLRMLGEKSEIAATSFSGTTGVRKADITILLRSIEAKTIAIDGAVNELKDDIAALRRILDLLDK